MNPKGTVPTLVTEEAGGTKKVLTESRDILNYCAELKPELKGGAEAEKFVERFYEGDLAYNVAAGVAAPDDSREALLKKWGERVEDARKKMEASEGEMKERYREKMELVGSAARSLIGDN